MKNIINKTKKNAALCLAVCAILMTTAANAQQISVQDTIAKAKKTIEEEKIKAEAENAKAPVILFYDSPEKINFFMTVIEDAYNKQSLWWGAPISKDNIAAIALEIKEKSYTRYRHRHFKIRMKDTVHYKEYSVKIFGKDDDYRVLKAPITKQEIEKQGIKLNFPEII